MDINSIKNQIVPGSETEHVVCLAWAQKKRHIIVDGQILCQPKFSNHIRQRGECGYNSISISGIPNYLKKDNDIKSTHTDGIIPMKPLNEIEGIIQSSICKKCKKEYAKLFSKGHKMEYKFEVVIAIEKLLPDVKKLTDSISKTMQSIFGGTETISFRGPVREVVMTSNQILPPAALELIRKKSEEFLKKECPELKPEVRFKG
ncbi:MAG: hypothetical protein WC976_06290 [Caldisericia bacterium]